jgi:hypothetical protein
MKNNNPGTTIKCRFSNEVHKILEPNINIPSRLRWKNKKEFTDKEKLEMFDKIMELHQKCSSELTSYQYNRREKKRIQKARIERGYVPKKKTPKEQYLNSL